MGDDIYPIELGITTPRPRKNLQVALTRVRRIIPPSIVIGPLASWGRPVRRSPSNSGASNGLVADEGGDKEIRVIIPCLHSEGYRYTGLASGLNKDKRLELIYIPFEKVVVRALVTQNVQVFTNTNV